MLKQVFCCFFLLNEWDENGWCRNYAVPSWLKARHLIWKIEDKFIKNKTKDIYKKGKERIQWNSREEVSKIPAVS